MINFRKIIGEYNPNHPSLDETSPWFEWNSYCECCYSLNVPYQPSVGRYTAYRRYLKEVGIL